MMKRQSCSMYNDAAMTCVCVCVYLLTGGVRTGHSGVRSGGEKGSMTGSRS